MKKIIILLLLCLAGIQTKAQYYENDFSFSCGVVTPDQFIDGLKYMVLNWDNSDPITIEDYKYSGALFLRYKKSLRKRLQLGGALGIEQSKGIIKNNVLEMPFKLNHVTFAAEADSRWLNRDIIQLYSGIGFGYTFSFEIYEENESDEKLIYQYGHLNFQINLLGIRFGRTFGGFIETGVGYKGILNLGLSCQFE